MPKIVITPDYCKACSLCITACKKGVISLGEESNKMGYHAAVADESKDCIGCRLCAIICPEAAIEVYK